MSESALGMVFVIVTTMKNRDFNTRKIFERKFLKNLKKHPPKFFFPMLLNTKKKEITSRFDTPNFVRNKTAGFESRVGQNPPPPEPDRVKAVHKRKTKL